MASVLRSIFTNDLDHCIICGRPAERHHIFGGANRDKSTEDGLILPLCPEHHRDGKTAVHTNADTRRWTYILGQYAWESQYDGIAPDGVARELFRERYGKSYL